LAFKKREEMQLIDKILVVFFINIKKKKDENR
jgi:hypothetical protein